MSGPAAASGSIPTLLLAGGGTGGHIFPNIAIMEAVTELYGRAPQTHFLLSDRAIDASIAAEHTLPFTALAAKPFGIRPRTLWRFLKGWAPSIRSARALIREKRAQGPVVLVTTGGFVSAPCIQAGRVERIPMVMVNLDAVPGRANRWAAKHATRVLTSAPIASGVPAGWTQIPPIVRAAALPKGSAADCKRLLGLDPHRRVLLVTGASLGARSINQLMAKLAADHPAAFTGWQILHQTGDGDTSGCADVYKAANIPAVVSPFVNGMGLWWGAADVAVGRCGAGIVAEAWASATPSLFLPYPYHRDQHQRANAAPLVAAGAAKLFTDKIDPAQNVPDVGAALLQLLTQPESLDAMRKACASMGPADGARRVAEAVRNAASPR